MISVLIPTLNSERVLVPALAALVPGAAEGLLREVVLADGGSSDGTEKIADAAGCEFRRGAADAGKRLGEAAAAARGDWLLILDPASVLEEGWTREVAKFVAGPEQRAAAFRLAVDGYGLAPRLKEFATAAQCALTGRPRPQQGLLAAKRLFLERGGRPGRVVVLRTRIVLPS